MHEKFHHITVKMVPDQETPVPSALLKKSFYFSGAFSLNLAEVICPLQSGVAKDASLGTLWREILPLNGSYDVEIATMLPYYLPLFDNNPEHAFTIGSSELVVTSRMMQCFYSQQDKKTKEMQYYLCHSLGTESLRSEKRFRSFHMSPMKTFISKRIRCAAQSAEEMITDHFNEWAHDFVHEISALVDALRIASPTAGKHMLPQLSKSSLPIFWVAVEGKDGKTGCQQFAGAMQLAAFRSLTGLGSEHLVIVQDVLRHGASVSVHESALALSHTFCHYGNLGLALVHVCISCESVLSDAYRRFLIMRGVSNKKYKDSERDITFSQLLNLHFAAMFQLDEMKDSIDVLRIINWARQQRNDRVHTGEISKDVTESEVIKAIEAAEHLVSFVVSKSKDFRV